MSTEIAVDLPATPAAPGLARRAVERLDYDREQMESVALLTSELVTNALNPAGQTQRIRLTAAIRGGKLTLAVTDAGGGFAPPKHPRPDAADHGYGLFFVEQLACRWGVAAGTVWFELAPDCEDIDPPTRYGAPDWREECLRLALAYPGTAG